jgi:UMF1 family MFS transporter
VDWGEGFRRVWSVFEQRERYPGVVRFLVAKFFYENAISAVIIFMAVYAVKVMAFSDADVMYLLIVSTGTAVIGSVICGRAVDRWGPRRTLVVVLWGWAGSLVLVLITSQQALFWAAGSLVGICLGATWTSARPLMVHLVPEEMLGEFFGLYAFSGKAAAIFGPLIWGLVVMCFGSFEALRYRLALGAMLVLILIGLFVLWSVPERRSPHSVTA